MLFYWPKNYEEIQTSLTEGDDDNEVVDCGKVNDTSGVYPQPPLFLESAEPSESWLGEFLSSGQFSYLLSKCDFFVEGAFPESGVWHFWTFNHKPVLDLHSQLEQVDCGKSDTSVAEPASNYSLYRHRQAPIGENWWFIT